MTNSNLTNDHDVQSINIEASVEEVFDFIANPTNLPKWTNAFKEANDKSAVLATPNGELSIELQTKANKELGTIDWYMQMPNGTIGAAYSRVVASPSGKAIFSFILLAPPAPLEEIEGMLLQQMEILRTELQNLRVIFSH